MLLFLSFLLPDLLPCMAVILPVKLKTNNCKALYSFHVTNEKTTIYECKH